LIDEEKVAAHLENLAALMSAEELATLQSYARQIAELNCKMAALGFEVGRRNSEDDAGEANVREAVGRYHVLLVFNFMREIAPQELTVN
jgi:hypothetical protein